MPCQAAQARTETEPLKPTEFPEGPWQELHADYKGPIGKDWYLHVLSDQYSKFPVVNVVKSKLGTGEAGTRGCLSDARYPRKNYHRWRSSLLWT